MSNNKHHSHDNAKTIQALSVFVEQAAISGCKSGNERAEAINKWVAVLDALELGLTDPIEMQALKSALEACANDPTGKSIKQLNTRFRSF